MSDAKLCEAKVRRNDPSLPVLGSQVILAKIRLLSQSHVVHPGLKFFADNPPGTKIDPADVPGLKESGWTPELDALCVLRFSREFSSPDTGNFDGLTLLMLPQTRIGLGDRNEDLNSPS